MDVHELLLHIRAGSSNRQIERDTEAAAEWEAAKARFEARLLGG
jgi:hypothetical protein